MALGLRFPLAVNVSMGRGRKTKSKGSTGVRTFHSKPEIRTQIAWMPLTSLTKLSSAVLKTWGLGGGAS